MRIYPWTVQVNRDSVKDWSASAAPVKFVYGDTFLLAAKIEDFDYTSNEYEPKDFTADGGSPSALRVVIRKDRDSTSELYSFQDAYNQGILSGFGDLTVGQVEWLVALSDTDIKTDIDAAGGILSCWLEISYTDGDATPSTIAQVQITIVDQVDDGAAGTPPPSSPTYLTATEIDALYFNKTETMFWSVLSATTGTPPTLTGGGDIYVIPATGTTGAWIGNEGKIAVDDGSWTYYTPEEGWGASVVDDISVIQYISGAWGSYLVSGKPNLTTQYRMTYVNAAGEITESSTLTTNANGVLNTTVNYAGLSENTHHNTSDAAAAVVGATYRVKNDNNYWGLIGMTGSGSTVAGGAYVNTFHVYNQGYAMSMYTVDGNKPHVWYTDVGDSHNFSFTEKMRLTPDGTLLIGTPSAYGSEKLGVNGSVHVATAGRALTIDSAATTGAYLRFDTNGAAIADIGAGDQVFSGAATDLGFNVRAGNMDFGVGGIRKIRLTSSGLLIGTTTPYGSEKLGVNGDVYVNGNQSIAGDISATHIARFDISSAPTQNIRVAAGTSFLQVASSAYAIMQIAGAEHTRFDDSGALLINTTTPYGSEKLGVNGQVYANGGYAMANDDYVYLRGDSTTDGSVRMSYQTSDNKIKMESRAAGVWGAEHEWHMANGA